MTRATLHCVNCMLSIQDAAGGRGCSPTNKQGLGPAPSAAAAYLSFTITVLPVSSFKKGLGLTGTWGAGEQKNSSSGMRGFRQCVCDHHPSGGDSERVLVKV